MSQVKGDRFAFSYRERNKREVSFKNVKIENGKVQTRFTYQRATYDCKFVFENNNLALLTCQYEHADYGHFMEVYSFDMETSTLTLFIFKIENGNKFII